MIDMTLGEYIPDEGSDIKVDFDAPGLVSWARQRFGIELSQKEVEDRVASSGRSAIRSVLVDAAEARIDETDLSGIQQFLAPNYGVHQLVSWCRSKFGIEVDPDALVKAIETKAEPPLETIMAKARETYNRREVEYPVTFQMELTTLLMRQSPQAAARMLAEWANRRFNLGWTEQKIMSTPPAKIRQELEAAQKAFIETGKLEDAVAQAQKCATDAQLEQHLQERYGLNLPDWMRYLHGEEREHAIRARVETALRSELIQFEQQVLLQTLDQSWKDHLYGMDQLRDVINYRAFSQKDPRIEFKREGAKLFQTMLDGVRDRITDDIFKDCSL
ncbi:hypothetical protein J4558_24490 [Leptolyngbya sp. 15MV]|nr:hypothetical protein J4558_24490 [Leptolyngbya sp. 15MV]